ncbi:Smr/MutS family protein [Candidatus Dojkabacteria bacterium]|uniref:Smr/MutS family protein n=1 Tax=Candidatus Dojkabacteria bacterium TaxID=2099670 RepID=A0A955IAK7_9BACT|nr:Smr/MutS family protein [Candidatus Dojkabacteria bacterium]
MLVFDAELDFHQFGIIDTADIEKILFEFIEDSHYYDKKNLLVITGKGKVVKPLVKKLLGQNPYVKKFKQAGYFNGQEGAFEIELCS